MVQFLSINFFFLDFFNFLLGFSKVPVFFVSLCIIRNSFIMSCLVLEFGSCLWGEKFSGPENVLLQCGKFVLVKDIFVEFITFPS